MSEPLDVFAISGSLRKASFNTALLRAAVEAAPQTLKLDVFEQLREIPPYDEDVRAKGFPAVVEDMRARITRASALLIVTPEYNYSIPGVLKNAIDWASRPPNQPFAGKPVAIMGASGSTLGTARAQYHLRQTCVFLDMHPLNKPEVFVARAQEKFDAEGKLTDDPTRKMVSDLLVALEGWAKRLGAKSS